MAEKYTEETTEEKTEQQLLEEDLKAFEEEDEKKQLSDDPDDGQSSDTDDDNDDDDKESKEEDDDGFVMPEKFVGKSAEEIARSNYELEKKLGEQSSRIDFLQNEVQNSRQQAQQEASEKAPVTQATKDIFKQKFKEDPDAAMDFLADQIDSVPSRLELERRNREGAEHYQALLTGNEDFKELHPDIMKVAETFGHMIKPEFAGSKVVIDIAYRLAREQNLEKYVKSYKESKDKKLSKKRKHFTESSTTTGSGKTDENFSDLSLAEMEAELGVKGVD